jgi:pimeloyl-ACP methyl ester carboxylesterase
MADYPRGPQRVQLARKNPEAWKKFASEFLEHSAAGMALTLRGVLGRRPSIFALENEMRALDAPTLIIVGDEDDPCLDASVFMKRSIPRSGLVMFPQTGHTVNLEEPILFNRTVEQFLKAAETGAWVRRDTGVPAAALV